jgi:hypothetical protein
MPSRQRLMHLGLIVAATAMGAGCDLTPTADKEAAAREEAQSRALQKRMQAACSSPATYDRLKQIAFDDAIRMGNADPENLDTLAAHSLVRVEDPVVVSRDEALDVTLCKGRFILELPPGAERGFGGERRLVANVEYSAQQAADGSGLVYQIKGGEPIVNRLAAFDLRGQPYRPPATQAAEQVAMATPQPTRSSEPRPVARQPAPAPAVTPPPAPRVTPQARVASPQPPRQERAGSSRPSFNCRYGRSPSERMVCSSGRLAALDREMSSQFYSALSNSDASTRAELRRTRDRFLAYRDRCPNEDCIAAAYRDRMDEIADIAG